MATASNLGFPSLTSGEDSVKRHILEYNDAVSTTLQVARRHGHDCHGSFEPIRSGHGRTSPHFTVPTSPTTDFIWHRNHWVLKEDIEVRDTETQRAMEQSLEDGVVDRAIDVAKKCIFVFDEELRKQGLMRSFLLSLYLLLCRSRRKSITPTINHVPIHQSDSLKDSLPPSPLAFEEFCRFTARMDSARQVQTERQAT
jgi:hypothetical protein